MTLRALFFVAALILVQFAVSAQDFIYTTDGGRIKAKVVRILPELIEYSSLNDTSSRLIVKIDKAQVSRIEYENGTRDVFSNELQGGEFKGLTMSEQAIADANMQSKIAFRRQKISTCIWTALNPTYGLIAVGVHTIPPVYDRGFYNTDRPNYQSQSEYNFTYLEQMRRNRRKKVWEGFGIGSGIFLSWIVTAVVLSANN